MNILYYVNSYYSYYMKKTKLLKENIGKYKLLDWINAEKINWNHLSLNKNAIHILKKNIDKIRWEYLSSNINIFELDLKFLKNRMDIIRE